MVPRFPCTKEKGKNSKWVLSRNSLIILTNNGNSDFSASDTGRGPEKIFFGEPSGGKFILYSLETTVGSGINAWRTPLVRHHIGDARNFLKYSIFIHENQISENTLYLQSQSSLSAS